MASRGIYLFLTAFLVISHVQQTRAECPDVPGCAQDCPFGFAYDENGCQTSCECYEPCKNVSCAENQECEVVYVQCVTDPCPPIGRCTDIPDCEPVTCEMLCLYGFQKDSNGCDICACHEPCPATCPPGQACVIVWPVCQPGVKCNSLPAGSCEATPGGVSDTPTSPTTPPTCLPVACDLWCEFGFKKDEAGCYICSCIDPCETRVCPAGKKCVAHAAKCDPGSGACEEVRTECVHKCRSKEQSKRRRRSAQDGERRKRTPECPSMEGCMLECPHGLAYDQNECNICECLDPCKNMNCSVNEECQVQQVQCIRAPCPPIGSCVPKSSGCPSMEGCTLNCTYGLAYDQNECNICECLEPCKDIQCSNDEVCTVQEVQCIRAPCPPRGVCSHGPTASPCRGVEGCDLRCQYGWAYDENECNLCQCHEPCKDIQCSDDEVCTVQDVVCKKSPCPPVGVCSPKPSAAACPSMDNCDLDCQYGLAYDANECNICRCHEPCKYVNCAENEECKVVQFQCFRAPCPPLGMCAAKAPDCPDISGCQLTNCQYGLEQDSNGCDKCACLEPCGNVSCPAGEECQVVTPMCLEGVKCPQATGYCTPTAQGIAGTSTTPSSCPFLECELIRCQFGVKRDEMGCKTCSCINPCETHICPAGQKCVNRVDECEHSSEACDPTPYAVCEEDRSIRQNIPTAEELLGCCVSKNMSAGCKFICSPNFNVTVTNVETVLQCLEELPIYRSCAGGEHIGYTGCCRDKGTGTSCDVLCAADISVDVSYLQQFTTCLLSEYVNEAFACVQSGQPDRQAATPPSTGGSSTTTPRVVPEICRQNASVGPCKAHMPHWYYNTQTGNCEEFIYGGCDGNDNRFETQQACVATCMTTSTTSTPANCPELMCDVGCRLVMGENGCNKCVCDNHCPIVRCSRQCQYGVQKDANGCTTCDCVDPCIAVTCLAGYVCTYKQEPVCEDDVCQMSYRGQCSATNIGCPTTMNCTNSCSYGRVRNADKCETCECAQPCKKVECEMGKVCKITSALACVGENCEMRHVGLCAVECLPRPCPSPGCEYGYVKDANDCDTCECIDPCKDVTCRSGETCVPKTIPTYVGQDGLVSEVFIGQCENQSTCPPVCEMYCEYGLVKDSNGCPICSCFDPCVNVTCNAGRRCEASPIMETADYPYSFIGRCVEGVICSRPLCDLMYCRYGYQRDINGCEFCQCYDPCMNVTCGDNTSICQPRLVEESRSQLYNYVGECIKCTGMTCRIPCEYGLKWVTRNCPLCECHDPCQDVNCSINQHCVVTTVDSSRDYDAEYFYIGKCEPNPSCKQLDGCQICPYGHKLDKNGCETCDCYNPCELVDCRDGMTCQPAVDPQCKDRKCRYVSSCIPTLGECAYEMQQNVKRYAINLAEMPQLNCDMNGYYKPVQCDYEGRSCYCTAPNGQAGHLTLNLSDAVDVCFPEHKIIGTLRIDADFNLIAPGTGPVFKQIISKQLADVMLLADSKVTITEYYPGSIMADFVAADLDYYNIEAAEELLMNLAESNQILHLKYSDAVYQAQIINYRRFGWDNSTLEPWHDKKGLSRAGFLVLVILLPIVGALIIATVLACCIYRICTRRGSFEPMSNRSSLSFDQVMEKTPQKVHNGYDNPNYVSEKKQPVNPNAYSEHMMA